MKMTILILLLPGTMIAGMARADTLQAIWRTQGTQERTATTRSLPPPAPDPYAEPDDLLGTYEGGFVTATDPADKVAETLRVTQGLPNRAATRAASRQAALTRFGKTMAGVDLSVAIADGASRYDGGYNVDAAKPFANWAVSNGAKAALIAYAGGPATLGAAGVIGVAVVTQVAYDKFGKPIVNWTFDKGADVYWGPDRRERGNEALLPPNQVERARVLANARKTLSPGAYAEFRKDKRAPRPAPDNPIAAPLVTREGPLDPALLEQLNKRNPKVPQPQVPPGGNLDDALSKLKESPGKVGPETNADDPAASTAEDVMSRLDEEAENEVATVARRAKAQVKKQREAVAASRREAAQRAQAAADQAQAAQQQAQLEAQAAAERARATQQQADLEALSRAMSGVAESMRRIGEIGAPPQQAPRVIAPPKQKTRAPHSHPGSNRRD